MPPLLALTTRAMSLWLGVTLATVAATGRTLSGLRELSANRLASERCSGLKVPGAVLVGAVVRRGGLRTGAGRPAFLPAMRATVSVLVAAPGAGSPSATPSGSGVGAVLTSLGVSGLAAK